MLLVRHKKKIDFGGNETKSMQVERENSDACRISQQKRKRSFVVVFTPEPVIGSITCLHRSSDLIATCASLRSIPAALREDLDDLNIFFLLLIVVPVSG